MAATPNFMNKEISISGSSFCADILSGQAIPEYLPSFLFYLKEEFLSHENSVLTNR